MAAAIFLQNTIFTNYVLPFFLIWLVAFAVLQKTKLFGESGQLNALISLVVGFIVVAAFNYSAVINNLILFLAIGLVIVFVTLLLWGFISGGKEVTLFNKESGGIRWILIVILVIAVVIGAFWAFGIKISGGPGSLTDFLTNSISQPFWTNLIFIVLIGLALALILRSAGGEGK